MSGNKDLGIFWYDKPPKKTKRSAKIKTEVLFLRDKFVRPKFL
jgi:hypothetical protein